MKKLVLAIMFFVVAVAVGLIYFTYTRPSPHVANLLPDSTLLFVEVPDYPLASTQFRSTEAYALLREPDVQEFLAAPRAAIAATLGLSGPEQERAVNTGAKVLNLVKGEVFFAVLRLGASVSRVRSHLVLGVDVKRQRLEATTAVGYFEERIAAGNPGASVARRKYFGVRYSHWRLPDGREFCYAFLNSLWIITTDEDDMRDIISRFTGQAPLETISLGSSVRFQNARRLMPIGNILFACFNVEQLMGIVGPLLTLAPHGSSMLQNIARIQTAASSVTITEDLVEDVGLVSYSRRDTPLSQPLRNKTLAFTSPETSFYSVRSFDWAAAYGEVLNTLAHSGNATLSSAATQFEQALVDKGTHIREDLLARLGPETALLARWRTGARWPDAAMVTEFDGTPDGGRALDAVFVVLNETLLGRSDQARWEQTAYLGETLHTARLADSPFAPTYLMVDRYLILALTADYARELVAQLKTGKRTLAANPSYDVMMKRLPKSATALTYCDLRTVYGQLYSLAHANAGVDTNAFLQLSKLPQPETIEKHLSPYLAVTTETETHSATVALSPLGKPLTVLVGAAGAIAAAEPLLAHLPLDLIPNMPTPSSNRDVLPPPPGNRTAPSQTPATR